METALPDPRWKDLYRIGAVSCIVFPAAIAFAIIAFFIWPYTPGFTSVANIFDLLQSDRLGGLMSLDLSVIILMPIMVLPTLALYAALKQVNESYALIALAFGLMGTVLWLAARPLVEMTYLSNQYAAATSDGLKSQYLAAGETIHAFFNGTNWMLSQFFLAISSVISSLLMLRSTFFGKATGYVGIGLAVLGFNFWIPGIGAILSLVGTFGGVIWYSLLARDFLRLGWSQPAASQ